MVRKERKNMKAEKSNNYWQCKSSNSLQAKEKRVFVEDTGGFCARKPGLVTALVLHYVRCSGFRLENFQANNTFAA
jgi:hypothetical protein